MRHLFLTSVGLLAVVISVVSLTPAPAAGQALPTAVRNSDAADTWTVSRTRWGDPALQGTYTNKTITPLERPDEVGERELFTEEEAAARDEDAATRADRPPREGSPGTYNAFWWDRGKILPSRRTSLVVDPPEGRLPALTPEGQKRADIPRTRGADSPEDRHLYERCIIRHSLPAAMSPTAYNSNYQILQTPDHVVIQIEMTGHVRIIPLDRRPHLPPSLRQWMGDSRGRWEGNTLVVETTNLSDKALYQGSGSDLRFVERFTRVAADTIDYQFTITDPTTFTRPWTAAIPLRAIPDRIYEYACHEGNRGMAGILSGARADERAAEAAATQNR